MFVRLCVKDAQNKRYIYKEREREILMFIIQELKYV